MERPTDNSVAALGLPTFSFRLWVVACLNSSNDFSSVNKNGDETVFGHNYLFIHSTDLMCTQSLQVTVLEF